MSPAQPLAYPGKNTREPDFGVICRHLKTDYNVAS